MPSGPSTRLPGMGPQQVYLSPQHLAWHHGAEDHLWGGRILAVSCHPTHQQPGPLTAEPKGTLAPNSSRQRRPKLASPGGEERGWCLGSLCPLSGGASPCLSGIIAPAPRSPCPAQSFRLALCLHLTLSSLCPSTHPASPPRTPPPPLPPVWTTSASQTRPRHAVSLDSSISHLTPNSIINY